MTLINKKNVELNQRVTELEKYISSVETNFSKSLSLLKYRIWQYNTITNLMLYEQLLSQKTKKPNFHPLVSIVIPVYNGANFLAEAINSALNQTYDNLEILVINDGSNDQDATRKIAQSFGNKIRYYEKPNGGVSSALNYGIKKMHGEYFAWLSHDDLITKDHIEKLVEWVSFKGTDSDIPFSMFNLVDKNGHILLNETIEAQLFCSDFKISYYKNDLSLLQGEINGGSVLIPQKAFDDFGAFDETQPITQERDLWDRLMNQYHFINLPYTTASIRCHSAQVTNTKNKVIELTNQKNLTIIKNLSEKRRNSLFGDDLTLLEHLKRSYLDNNKTWLATKIDDLIQTKKQ